MTTPERWQDVQRVVDRALDLAPEARTAYLDSVCGSDASLRREATRLLEARERAARNGPPPREPEAREHRRRQRAVGQRLRKPLGRCVRRAGLADARGRCGASAGVKRPPAPDVWPDRRPQPLGVDVGRGTKDREAYDLYLEARYYWHERGAQNVIRSIEYFQKAIARDPTFARVVRRAVVRV
jgi:hypothetical protein